MSEFIIGLVLIFLVYELGFKDAFGVRGTFVNHFQGFEKVLYSTLVTLILPILLLIIFKESHVYTARNLDNFLIVLSIFVSILFGVMGDISAKDTIDTDLKNLTMSSAIYITTQCLISMILTFGLMTSYTSDADLDMVFKVLNLVNFYLVFSILINTVLILKRFSKLIRD